MTIVGDGAELAIKLGKLTGLKCKACGHDMALTALHEDKRIGNWKEFRCVKCNVEETTW